jgi:two-component system NtrC family sensor kinase
MIVEQADRCKKIVSNLLDFARENRVVLLPADIHQLIESALKALPPPPGITVEFVNEVDGSMADLDKDQITQVITNLISNAYAAMEENGGRLMVRTFGNEYQVGFQVKDSGIGITRENMRKLFTPFFTTKKMGRGTGLGLAVTYGIVKMHRGDIQVESNADPAAGPTGASFTVTLPRQPKTT